MKTCVILNHDLTEEQRADLGGEIIELPPELKKIWGNIPPEIDSDQVTGHLDPLTGWLYSNHPDQVVCQGDFTAFVTILDFCGVLDCKFLVATSRRESQDIQQPDGSVKKVAVFNHVQFREI